NRVLMYPQASLGTNGAAATTVLGQSVFTSGSSSFETATSETEPNALTFDSSGNLWIVDGGPSRVLEYTTPFSNDQAATTVIGKSGFNVANCDITQDGGCFFRDGPTGISFDSTHNLWVADAGNNRVLQFLTSPSAPTGVTASSASTSSITISWAASSGATSYTVYRSTSPSGPFTTSVGTSTTTSFIDSGLSKATTYYYEVTASNSGGDSPLSSPPASATTLAVFVPEFPLGIPIAIGAMSALYFVMRYKFGGMPKF
ncbi:MAG: fibronectin type III domain-containing protein, partial [Thaumarchaeota archaeon]|nr:fibronectin type III domain-containing protein [Nitrososphaerota archaeon]